MENFSILIGVVFWPVVIVCWLRNIRQRKLKRPIAYLGTILLIGMPLLGAVSLGKYMFLDEPLYYAVGDGDVAKVKQLLSLGASPNIEVHGNHVIVVAAASGQVEIVRMLMNHGARIKGGDDWRDDTPLQGGTDVWTHTSNQTAETGRSDELNN